jgi:hypothetical protein
VSQLAQRRLTSIVEAVNSQDGFYYPHSGDRISARTTGILYDVLSLVVEEVKSKGSALKPFQLVDNIRVILGSRAVRLATTTAILLLIGIIGWQWYTQPNTSLADLGPELLGGLILQLILSGRKEVS